MKQKKKQDIKKSERKVDVFIKLNINAMEASSKEPIGPTLGQYGIPINEFCEIFNDLTKNYKEQTVVGARLVSYNDDSFEVTIAIPTLSSFLLKCLMLDSINLSSLKRKAGFFELKNEYLPIFNKNIIYTIINYISNNLHDVVNVNRQKSLFKKVKGTIHSSGYLIYKK